MPYHRLMPKSRRPSRWTYLRRQRLRKRLTVKDLAAASGYSVPYLYNLEHGYRGPSDEVIITLADILECDAGELDRTKPQVPTRAARRSDCNGTAA